MSFLPLSAPLRGEEMLVSVCSIDILKEYSVNYVPAKKKLINCQLIHQWEDLDLTKHEVKISDISDLDIVMILCGYYDVYVCKNKFYLEVNEQGVLFLEAINKLKSFCSYEIFRDPLGEFLTKMFKLIQQLLVKQINAVNW